MNTQRLKEWIRQYNQLLDSVIPTYLDNKNQVEIEINKRKEDILQTIIKEAKAGAYE